MRIEEIGGKRVLFVMAAPAEYGDRLKARIDPLMTGIGPVEAAVQLSALLSGLAAKQELPHLVVSLGSAGSAHLEQTEVYQVSSVSYRDMDVSPLGFEKGRTPFLDLPKDVALPFEIPGIAAASLSTGANIVSGAAAYAAIGTDMVDMETFAILRACQNFALPLIGLRGISDGRDDLKHVEDWTQYLHIIDEKLAISLDRLESAIETGTITL
ncbi:5'-methylthioadenosine/S-adenosylhomocysteine nucleosidase [Martelella sp. HB161492]|uniref:5'-methylthioadenosine/S-adenosylhomocysteine nucleosidase n=1 Tax=Martelella sp. HB161492 TaxID=2720726 RepID=UPI0015929B5B|nr:5'-methylthioadenosine/S-adenosylhomocysteine nucleosidase [Martelella sp. HB161492]